MMDVCSFECGIFGGSLHRAMRQGGRLLMGTMLMVGLASDLVAGQVPGVPQSRPRMGEEAGSAMDYENLLERLRRSGLSRAQARAQLRERGLNPDLADQYYDLAERGEGLPRGSTTEGTPSPLGPSGIGSAITPDTIPGARLQDSIDFGLSAADPVLSEPLGPGELPVFGREIFQRPTSQFQAVTTGPVDPDYRLGPGDQLYLILTGDVETAYTLDVTRQGFIVIPDVGQVAVNGLTMRELEDRLYERLGRVYSGVGRGAGATTQFQASLGALRANQVFVIGDVERPGAYQVSAVATAFNALYMARGPTRNGSFRRIEVRRGGRVVQTIDLYDYLLRGDSRDDIRLEQGDILFVPVVGTQVGIQGAVRRSALYELAEGDGLRDLLRYAGRLEAEALVQRVQIDRILPPTSRQPGVDRVLVDVDVRSLLTSGGSPIQLYDGDRVRVFSVTVERRNRLTVTGEVRRPGLYEWTPGTTLWTLIDRAEGLADQAYVPRAHIYRLNEEDGTRSLVRTPLLADGAGNPVQDVALADRDSVVIFSRGELRTPETVSVAGFVKNPGFYSLSPGMTVRDLVLAAGGFTHGADVADADVARMTDPTIRSDTTAQIIRVSLLSGEGPIVGAAPAPGGALLPPDNVPTWTPSGGELQLVHGDHVFIRQAAGYQPLRSVHVTGEVLQPGTYVLQTRKERLTDVLARSGGLTSEANPDGLQLLRDGKLVATDLERARRQPTSAYNLELEPGDSIHLPRFDPTVLVVGAVTFESRVLFVPGRGLDYYVNRAGGYGEAADKGRVSVTYQDGERAAVERSFGLLRKPEIRPGSTIFVPADPEDERNGIDWDRVLSRTLSVVTTAITLIVAANQL